MARKPRIHYPGALYHVMLRGNGGQDIFESEVDREYFLSLVEEGVERFSVRVHAYCLMDNHVHFAVQVGAVPLSRFMQNVSFRYTRYLNAKRKVVGHLFQGRFKAILVEQGNYLLQLVRYIHLNPKRAGKTDRMVSNLWCSHPAYIEHADCRWLTTKWVLSQFASGREAGIAAYESFLHREIDTREVDAIEKGRSAGVLGSDNFIEWAMKAAGRATRKVVTVDGLLLKVADVFKLDPVELRGWVRQRSTREARCCLAWVVRELEGVTLKELALHVGRDISAMNSAAKKFEQLCRGDVCLQNKRSGLLEWAIQ